VKRALAEDFLMKLVDKGKKLEGAEDSSHWKANIKGNHSPNSRMTVVMEGGPRPFIKRRPKRGKELRTKGLTVHHSCLR